MSQHPILPTQIGQGSGINITRHRINGRLMTSGDAYDLGIAHGQNHPLSALQQLNQRPIGVDALGLYHWSNVGRLDYLLPVRAKRMSASAFNYFRGMPALMLYDQARESQHSGLWQQICGDCHLNNFGGFASPERQLLFGLTDFDETLIAPFEWDLKRLSTSIIIAARQRQMTGTVQSALVRMLLELYQLTIENCRKLSPLEQWYQQWDADDLLENTANPAVYQTRKDAIQKVKKTAIGKYLAKISDMNDKGQRQFLEQPPLQQHPTASMPFANPKAIEQFFADYRQSLKFDRQVLFDRYDCHDVALRVVGVGSVGTVSAIALFEDADREPLILQMKEARPSILASLLIHNESTHQGERVIHGQQMLQSASDIFLGFATLEHANMQRDFYVRQLRDMKYSIDLDELDDAHVEAHIQSCATALAYAHAKSGHADVISGYLNADHDWQAALIDYAQAAADRNAEDYAQFLAAIADGQIAVAGDDAL